MVNDISGDDNDHSLMNEEVAMGQKGETSG